MNGPFLKPLAWAAMAGLAGLAGLTGCATAPPPPSEAADKTLQQAAVPSLLMLAQPRILPPFTLEIVIMPRYLPTACGLLPN